MDRRKFFAAAGNSAATLAASSGIASGETAPHSAASAGLPPLKARLGHQFGTSTHRTAAWVARYGVDAICTSPVVKDPARLYPTVDELNGMLFPVGCKAPAIAAGGRTVSPRQTSTKPKAQLINS